jgi:hypothetical protein
MFTSAPLLQQAPIAAAAVAAAAAAAGTATASPASQCTVYLPLLRPGEVVTPVLLLLLHRTKPA